MPCNYAQGQLPSRTKFDFEQKKRSAEPAVAARPSASGSSLGFGGQRLGGINVRNVAPPSAEYNPSETPPPPNAGNQRGVVLQLLRKRGSQGLSSLEALRYAIMRLPNRIGELRAQGFQIASRSEPNGCRRYFLRSEPRDPKPLPSYAERSRQLEAAALPLFERVHS